MKRPSPLAFYEEVLVETTDPQLKEIDGERGVILGAAEAGDRWTFGVFIYSKAVTWSVDEKDLRGTGLIRKREEFYDGTSIRVSPDGAVVGGRANLLGAKKPSSVA